MMVRNAKKSPPQQQQRYESNTLPRRNKKGSPKTGGSKGLTPSPPPPHSLSTGTTPLFGSLNSVQSPDFMWRSSSVSINSITSSCDSLASRDDVIIDSDMSQDIQLHPLQNTWKFWCINASSSGSWSKNLKEIKSFATVEDFWSIWERLKAPTELPGQYSYFLFKSSLRPEWEDKGNRDGGRWLFTFNRKNPKVNDAWLETVMGIIGEMFDEDGDEICGAALDIRRSDKVGIWTRNWQNKDRIMKIGEKIKAALGAVDIICGFDVAMHYERHDKLKSEGALYRL